MSTPPPAPSSRVTKRLACLFAPAAAAALLLLLPQTQQALPRAVRHGHTAAMLLRPAARLLPGANDFWHTDGNRILDSRDRPVRIAGMNWSGLETKEAVPGGLEVQDYRAILRTIQQNGYNTVRIPFSNEMVESPSVPEHIRFSAAGRPINTDLQGLSSLEILDRIIAYSGKIGLKVILDNHRSEAGSSAEESGLWYTRQFPETAWIEDWKALALRYANTSTVIGMDLRNEPHNADKGGACWDCGGENDWHRAAQRAGNAILAINPRLLIFVEGVDSYAGDSYWWGGNLEGVRRSPVRLAVPNHLVYSAHEYGPTEYAQPWFNDSTSAAALASTWRKHWAYISESAIAPVWIGEFGTSNSETDIRSSLPGSEGQWFSALVEFLGSHPSIGWTYWGVNGEDRYGLLDMAYSSRPANQLKFEALASITSNRAAIQVNTASLTQENYDTVVPHFHSHSALDESPAGTREGRTLTRVSEVSTRIPEVLRPAPARFDTSHAAVSGSRSGHRTTQASEGVEDAIAASVHNAVSVATQSLSN